MIRVLLLFYVVSSAKTHASGFWFEEILSFQLSNQNNVASGVVDAINFVYQIAPFAEMALGAQIQFGSGALYQSNFGFDSVFLSFRFPVQTVLVSFYPVIRGGYGFFIGNPDFRGAGTLPAGLLYALGAGCRSPDFTITSWGASGYCTPCWKAHTRVTTLLAPVPHPQQMPSFLHGTLCWG